MNYLSKIKDVLIKFYMRNCKFIFTVTHILIEEGVIRNFMESSDSLDIAVKSAQSKEPDLKIYIRDGIGNETMPIDDSYIVITKVKVRK